MTRFTKGPWRVGEDWRSERVGDGYASNCYRDYLAGYNIMSDTGEVIDSEGLGIDERDEANARLIAAAPDLYAALEAMLSSHDSPAARFEANAAGRKALAKARGE